MSVSIIKHLASVDQVANNFRDILLTAAETLQVLLTVLQLANS